MEELCRICLKKCLTKKPTELKVLTAIDDIFKIQVGSDVPFLVCLKCKASLLKFHQFFLQTRKNFEFFTESIETPSSEVKTEDFSVSLIKVEKETVDFKPDIIKTEDDSDHNDDSFEWEETEKRSRKCRASSKKKKTRLSVIQRGPFTCDLCNKTIPRFVDLRSHIEKIHLRLRKFQCHLCGDNFFTSNNLKFHLTTHDNTRPRSQCKICGVLVLDLKKHFKTSHNNANPVVCNICGKSLMNEMKLRYHTYKRHPPQGKYRCKICDKDFCNALYLKEHSHQKHIGGFLYTCEWCDFQTNYSKNMPTHQKLKHKEEYEARRRARPPMMSRVHEMKATLALQSPQNE